MKEEFIIDALAYLVDACQIAEQRFLLCARQARQPESRERFLERASRAHQSARALQNMVEDCGGQPAQGAMLRGVLHHWWLRGRAMVSRPLEEAWLKECNRTEATLLQHFKVIAHTSVLPPHIQSTVDRQFYAWQRIHEQMRSLLGRHRGSV